jgi:hypothetical protein
MVRRENPKNKRHNLQQRNTTIDIVSRSQSAVRNAYLAFEVETAKLGLKKMKKRKNI